MDRTEYFKQYDLKNQEKRKAYKRQYRLDNKEKLAASYREYYLKNMEKIKAKSKLQYENIDKNQWSLYCQIYFKDRYSNDPGFRERRRQKWAEWRAKNPDSVNRYNKKANARRAKKYRDNKALYRMYAMILHYSNHTLEQLGA